ncbi:hypothetical protein HRbin23_00636 [bacterium HR23]|nr:hypothetical protein HRbin23_00636 [bacterium HR23]
MRLKAQDLLRLRRLHLALQRAKVALAHAQADWEEAVAEIEEAYGLVGRRVQVDIATGEIQVEEALKTPPISQEARP